MTLKDQTQLQIRQAKPKDTSLILQFIRELAEYEKLSHEVVADEGLLREKLFGPRPVAEVLLGERDGEAVAFAIFFQNFSTFLGRPGIYLEDLYVRPQYRSLGVGKLFLRHLAQIALERDCGRFEWSVLNWNKPAINFYEKLGAKPNDGWTVYRLIGDALRKLAQSPGSSVDS